MDTSTPAIRIMMQALNKVERDNRSYDSLRIAYEAWYGEYTAKAMSPLDATWLNQIYFMRLFFLAVHNDRPLSECESAFQQLRILGYSSIIGHFLILWARARYMADAGDIYATGESIEEMKHLAETSAACLPKDWKEIIQALERELNEGYD